MTGTSAAAGWRATVGPVLAPDGAAARGDAPLAWALLLGGALLFVFVMVLLGLALRAPARPVRPWRWLAGGGVLLPLVVLGALAVANVRQWQRLFHAPPADALLASVHGRLWWWQVRLRDPAGGRDLVLANEIVLPVGRPLRLALASDNVIHSLWVPALAGKVDLVPGRVQPLVLQADRAGTWRGPCAEFCGDGHTQMQLQVTALPPEAFDRWLQRQRQTAREPTTSLQQRGRERFVALRCGVCHALRGVAEPLLGNTDDPALGDLADAGGPDLTHLASRRWLGAGTLRNDADGLRRWLTGVQRLKPGARMPSYGHLDGETLDALVAYLGSLE